MLNNLETEINGHQYVIIHEEIERKTGFARGYELSKWVNNIKKITEYSPNKKIVIKNTTEDLDFYNYIFRKIPTIYFTFDKEYALQYSNNTLLEWNEFITDHKHKLINFK